MVEHRVYANLFISFSGAFDFRENDKMVKDKEGEFSTVTSLIGIIMQFIT